MNGLTVRVYINNKEIENTLDLGNVKLVMLKGEKGDNGNDAYGEALPIGSEIEFDGNTPPVGWEEIMPEPIYSSEEIVCGTWINDKPLYRKVTRFNLPIVTTDGVFPSNSVENFGSNIDFCIIENAYITLNNYTKFCTLPYINNNGRIAEAFMQISNNVATIQGVSNDTEFNNAECFAFVIYTKTTD